jgi:phosphoribosylanthranilate isomerase
MKPKIKICGLTNLIDAKNALNLGADFIGFINIISSPRFVSIQDLELISSQLTIDERSRSVLVLDSRSEEDLINLSSRLGFKIVQNYSDLKLAEINKLKLLGYKIFKPLRVAEEEDIAHVDDAKDLCDLMILDTKLDNALGGTGQSFDWLLFDKAKRLTSIPLGLAGGLNSSNIVEAIALTKPYLVDISSSLESKPGIKSLDKMKLLFSTLNNIPQIV